ncbi:hypothetical protein DFH09DRAFT_1286612 [Mycena vulgaris]|nr:hypothetical protein DFH09DRAFT_1286612 [Mycena vulgaris]
MPIFSPFNWVNAAGYQVLAEPIINRPIIAGIIQIRTGSNKACHADCGECVHPAFTSTRPSPRSLSPGTIFNIIYGPVNSSRSIANQVEPPPQHVGCAVGVGLDDRDDCLKESEARQGRITEIELDKYSTGSLDVLRITPEAERGESCTASLSPLPPSSASRIPPSTAPLFSTLPPRRKRTPSLSVHPPPCGPPQTAAPPSTSVTAAVYRGPGGASVPYTASDPEPYSSADLATPTRDKSMLVHTGHSSTSIPAEASGLLPSHPAALGAGTSPSKFKSHFPTPPLVASPPILTPHASTEDSYLASMPSLRGDGEGDSGYAAWSEIALVETPSSMSLATPSSSSAALKHDHDHGHEHGPASFASQNQSEGPRAPANSAATGSNFAKTGSAALNSSDPKDLFPDDTLGLEGIRAARLANTNGKTRVERKATNPSANPNDVFPSSSTPAAPSAPTSQSASAAHVLGGASEPKGLPSVPASEAVPSSRGLRSGGRR